MSLTSPLRRRYWEGPFPAFRRSYLKQAISSPGGQNATLSIVDRHLEGAVDQSVAR